MLTKEYKLYLLKANDYLAEGLSSEEAFQKAFTEVMEATEGKGLVEKMKGILYKAAGVDQKTIIKSVDDEKRLALFVVMSPDDVDAHGDVTTAEEIEKACNNYNTYCNKANLYHMVETDKAQVVQSFINPSEFETEDGRTIKKGAWLQWWHFPKDDEDSEALWKSVKEGKITGVSIGARGTGEDIDE